MSWKALRNIFRRMPRCVCCCCKCQRQCACVSSRSVSHIRRSVDRVEDDGTNFAGATCLLLHFLKTKTNTALPRGKKKLTVLVWPIIRARTNTSLADASCVREAVPKTEVDFFICSVVRIAIGLSRSASTLGQAHPYTDDATAVAHIETRT